jgi:hypothetical protein
MKEAVHLPMASTLTTQHQGRASTMDIRPFRDSDLLQTEDEKMAVDDQLLAFKARPNLPSVEASTV